MQVLRAQTDAGDEQAARHLARLRAEHGDVDGAVQILGAQAVAGDEAAAMRLPDFLAGQGREEDAERLRRFGLNPDGSIAST